MVEVYPRCPSRDFSDNLVTELTEGWSAVFAHLVGLGVGPIVDLSVLEISLLENDEMARLHGEFLSDETTTDVITFEHGELLIGVEVAERQSEKYGVSFELELALYGIHGMLHLSGYDDQVPAEAAQMARYQEDLLALFFPQWL